MVSNKPHILILDNEPISSHVLARVLAAEYRVQRVPDANHILDAVRRPGRRPDLILLDVSPPKWEGFDICRQIKEDEMTQSVPVMLITQGDHADDEVRGFKLGAADCITRPFRLDLVKARIRRQIRLKINNDLLERYANQDCLTDIANRRRFDLALDAEWRRAMRDVNPLSLLMVDVDCFKQYNDLYGHLEGDQCLRQIAGAMAQVLTRPGDLLARYGGEEFAVILPGTDLEGACLIGGRLREAIAEMNIPHLREDGVGRVTISVGCASERPTQAQSCHQLILTADNQLYAAKNAGRDCVRAGKKTV
ncbi:MAG: diguanylate cyclase [Gallionellaceae bacterium]|nr:diguanylate cyclase [Gallionellaceae bacterium]